MSKHILFNESGALAARYDSEIHGDNIPADALEVSEELFIQTVEEQDGIWTLVDDEIVKLPQPGPTVAELIAAKFAEINAACEREISAVKTEYPDSEVLSWAKQESEARAYVIDATAPTPLLTAIAAAREIPLEILVGKVIEKADTFAIYTGSLIGKRQKLESQIKALDESATAADVAAITW